MISVDMSSSPFLAEATEWCDNNIKNNWEFDHRNVLTPDPKFFFKFDDKKDATIFILRWYKHSNEQHYMSA